MSENEQTEAQAILTQIDDALSKAERVARLQMWIIVMTAAAVLWGARLEFRLNGLEQSHERLHERATKLEDRQDDLRQRMTRTESKTGAVSQNVNVNTTSTQPEKEESARTFLTVQEVAERENVADRTVLNWIEEGRIVPAPVKEGKAWVIAESFRILPHVAAAAKREETELKLETER